MLLALDQLRTITKSLEDEMAVAPDGVIPWLKLEVAGAECCGEISHASALKVVDFWREGFYAALKAALKDLS